MLQIEHFPVEFLVLTFKMKLHIFQKLHMITHNHKVSYAYNKNEMLLLNSFDHITRYVNRDTCFCLRVTWKMWKNK